MDHQSHSAIRRAVRHFISLAAVAFATLTWADAANPSPKVWKAGTETLVLNGAGVREYSVLRIAVYTAGLYLVTPQTSAEAILDSAATKVVHLRMLRSVARDDSAKAWDYYLAANCVAPCVIDAEARAAFLALVPEARAGDTQIYTFRDGQLTIEQNGRLLGRIAQPAFARLVLATWIGAVPTTSALKRALLGGS